jgi:K+-transporting ATPase ATPase C chain
MRKDLVASAAAVAVFTVLLGLVYPLVMTGLSQVAFPGAADGSRIERNGKLIGSSLIGQDFRRQATDADGQPRKDADGEPVLEADPRYFQSRPSATGYNPAGTYFNNLGPNSSALRDQFVAYVKAYLALEGPDNPGLQAKDIPVDAVQTSASGVDPHISPENAAIQAARVARERDVALDRVRALVDENTDDRSLGVLGEPGVNVLELNLALDHAFPRDDR